MVEARNMTGNQEVGETVAPVMDRFKDVIEEAVQKSHEKGVKGRYYIHIWVQKEPYAQNALRIYPQCRRTRPSPYQGHDHFLWKVEDGGKVTFEWCIPNKETLGYILSNPDKFDVDYVRMLRRYVGDKLESLQDYSADFVPEGRALGAMKQDGALII
jgi:hypothetical protein